MSLLLQWIVWLVLKLQIQGKNAVTLAPIGMTCYKPMPTPRGRALKTCVENFYLATLLVASNTAFLLSSFPIHGGVFVGSCCLKMLLPSTWSPTRVAVLECDCVTFES